MIEEITILKLIKKNIMNKIIRLLFICCASFFILSACQTISPDTSSPDSNEQNHPLIDKVWSVSEQKFISLDKLNKAILDNDVILLGETHDNIKHHQLQAQVIKHLTVNQHSPAIAYEMLNQSQQPAIDEFQAHYYQALKNGKVSNVSEQVDIFAQRIHWEKSGWPEWHYYQPVFYNTIENQLPIIAANLNIKTIRKVIKQGSKVLDKSVQEQLIKYQYDDVLQKELEKEILSSHCDMLPEKMLAPMLLGQQVRDLAMTQAILSTLSTQEETDKLVLIAGAGHTRTDYGVPFYLHKENPKLNLLSLTFMEVSEDEFKPESYVKAWSDTATKLPFDYVWFTEKSEREDQCEKMKAYMKKKSA